MIKESQIKEELERAKQERLAEVEKGKVEAKRLAEAAKKETEILRSKVEEQARLESQKIISYGKEEVEKLRQELMANLKDQAVGLSIEMVQYTLTEKGKDNLQHQLIEELITDIDGLEKEKFTAKSNNNVSIISSFSLAENQRKRLLDVLTAKLGHAITVEEKIDPQIISGIIIQIGEFVIDGSLKNKLYKAVPYLHFNK